MSSIFDIGDVVRCEGRWTDSDGNPVDPTVVLFYLENPSEEATSYPAYGEAGSPIVRSGAGIYYADCHPDAAGFWTYKWVSTGTGKAAESGQFEVRTPRIAT